MNERVIAPLRDLPNAERIIEQIYEPEPPERYLNLGLALITSRAWCEWHRARGIDPDLIPDDFDEV